MIRNYKLFVLRIVIQKYNLFTMDYCELFETMEFEV